MRGPGMLSTLVCLLLCVSGAGASVPPDRDIDHRTWVDHDALPIPQPPEWEPNFYGHMFRQAIEEPLSHAFDIPDKLLILPRMVGAKTDREAANVNAFDEVPSSSWFTNRNHVRAVPVAEMRHGPAKVLLPKTPWTIKHAKKGGQTAGFQIKDADGKKWLIKLDPVGYPQLVSGADMVSRTLLHAAGYNVPNNQPIRFRREDLRIDEDLLKGTEGERMNEGDLQAVLDKGARFPDSSYSGLASLFIPGEVLGAPSMKKKRPGDPNEWYTHNNRRELRGLYVLFSWLNSWDTKDHNFIDVFVVTTPDSLGHVDHYVLDVGASLGAAGLGPREYWHGYENTVDWGWMARRLVTLGFAVEPWRHAHSDPGIPSVGNFESAGYRPEEFKPLQEQQAFRKMTDRDGYWGAKLVASFSKEQIAAAIEAAGYDDPRAREYLQKTLLERQDKVIRYWFHEVTPLDFFDVQNGTLRFHDLALDKGITGPREYVVTLKSEGPGKEVEETIRLQKPALPLSRFGMDATRLELVLSIPGNRGEPVRVELSRVGDNWVVTGVRHG
jgi:hypothetical protein